MVEFVEGTYSPAFEYRHVHHIPRVTAEFVAYIQGKVEMFVHVTQKVDPSSDKIGTGNEVVKESIITGVPKGYEKSGAVRPKSDVDIQNEELQHALHLVTEENVKLKSRVSELEARLAQYEKVESRPKSALSLAKSTDKQVNG